VLPIAEEQRWRAQELVRRAVGQGLRAELVGPEHGSLGARIRDVRLVPYQAVIGEREAEGELVAVRLRDGRRPGAMGRDELLGRIGQRVGARGCELWEDV